MAQFYDSLSDVLTRFIAKQHVFFVGTAAQDGRVNVSPKGMDSLRVDGPNRIYWRNLTGSGNETAGHLAQVNRMTLMWCSFEGPPMILRCYGSAVALHPRDAEFAGLNAAFPPDHGARQIFDVQVDMVQTSCGYAVPELDFRAEREILHNWSEQKGPDGVKTAWRKNNQQTIDGMPTGILDDS